MKNGTILIKRKLRLINDKQYADAHAYYHKNLYEKFTELSNKYEQELKEVDRELEPNLQIDGTPLIVETENAIKHYNCIAKRIKNQVIALIANSDHIVTIITLIAGIIANNRRYKQ